MISETFVKKLATKRQTTELNILREYLQHLFLSYLYQNKKASNILFKGGTALCIVYGSSRFSEDLDFSGKKITFSKIEDIFLSTLSQVEKENIRVRIKESKKTSGGYLGIYKGEIFGDKITIQLEVSLRQKKMEGEPALITQEFIPNYTLLHLSEKILTAEKVKALLDRNKSRDWYDLYFILRQGLKIDFDELKMEREDLRKRIITVLDKKEEGEIERELKPLLPISYHHILKRFKRVIKREIEREI